MNSSDSRSVRPTWAVVNAAIIPAGSARTTGTISTTSTNPIGTIGAVATATREPGPITSAGSTWSITTNTGSIDTSTATRPPGSIRQVDPWTSSAGTARALSRP